MEFPALGICVVETGVLRLLVVEETVVDTVVVGREVVGPDVKGASVVAGAVTVVTERHEHLHADVENSVLLGQVQ